MEYPIPPHPEREETLRAEQAELESLIRRAFAGVTREGGVSWTETFVLDDYGDEYERANARAEDTEPSWESLVDDPSWQINAGTIGFCFLDAIGMRYYLPAAMIRQSKADHSVDIGFDLCFDGDAKSRTNREKQCSLLSALQRHAVYRFIVFMRFASRWHRDRWGEYLSGEERWNACLENYWGQFAESPESRGGSSLI